MDIYKEVVRIVFAVLVIQIIGSALNLSFFFSSLVHFFIVFPIALLLYMVFEIKTLRVLFE